MFYSNIPHLAALVILGFNFSQSSTSVNNEVKHINHGLESFFSNFLCPIYETDLQRIHNGFTTVLERICRLPSGSLSTGEGGGRGRGPFWFTLQSYSTFPTQSFQLSDFSVKNFKSEIIYTESAFYAQSYHDYHSYHIFYRHPPPFFYA